MDEENTLFGMLIMLMAVVLCPQITEANTKKTAIDCANLVTESKNFATDWVDLATELRLRH